MNAFIQDLRFSHRMLVKNPGFTLIAVLTLALGIGACTAIFSVLNALLVQPMPYADPDKVTLVLGWDLNRDSMNFNVSSVDFARWQGPNEVFDDSAAYQSWSANLSGIQTPQRLQGYRVTPNMFSLLGVDPDLGRTFDPNEFDANHSNAVVLSHRIWRNQFQANPDVVGETVKINDVSYVVVGVMPKSFEFPQGNYRGDLWVPMDLSPEATADRANSFSVVAVARLKSDVPLEQAQARMASVYKNLESDYPESNTGVGVRLFPFQEFLVGDLRPGLLMLFGAVGLLMLIAGSNVANLILARAQKRQREVAVRSALGAGRWRLIRQLCLENIVLSLFGCLVGVLFAFWMLDAMLAGLPDFIERVMPAMLDIQIDVRVLGFAFVLALVTGILFGIGPALSATRGNLIDALKEGGANSSGPGRLRLKRFMVTSEIALSVLLLVGAGLLMRSFENLKNIDTGFDAPHVLSGQFDLPTSRYDTNASAIGFYEALLASVQSIPDVETAGLVNVMPFSTSNSRRSIQIQGEEIVPTEATRRADYRLISDDYFKTMGIRMLAGRRLNSFDDQDSQPVAIVNEQFVERHLGGRDPIGAIVGINTGDDTPWREVVGVVADVLHHEITSTHEPEIYVPYAQAPRSRMTLVVRAGSESTNLVGAIRTKASALDPDLPLFAVQRVDQALAQSMYGQSMMSMLMSGFSIVALVLTAVGLYGLISYSVNQRRSEFGLRMAVGAKGKDVIWLVLKNGLPLTMIGIGVGLTLAFLLTRLIASQLHDISPADPITYGAVTALVMGIALLAHYLPARRASSIDPMTALRSE